MKMSQELAEKYAHAEKIKLLEAMQEEEDYQVHALNKSEVAQKALNKISKYSLYLKNVKRTADAVTQIGEHLEDYHDTAHNQEIAHGFHIGSLALSAFNFFRIPFMYLSAYMLNQKIPVTLSNNMRWLYSAVLLGLTITAIAVPVTAPIIAFVSAGIGFAASVFLLGKVIHERIKLRREAKALKKEIGREEEEMLSIQEQAKQLKQNLEEATEEQHIIDLSIKIERLEERYHAQSKVLGDLYDKQLQNNQLREALGIKKILFKSTAVILASATIIGLVVSLFFPPVGLGILAAVATVSATLLLGRVLAPAFQALHRWFTNKQEPVIKNEGVADEHVHVEHSLDHQQSIELTESSGLEKEDSVKKELIKDKVEGQEEVDDLSIESAHHDSTADVLHLLNAEHIPSSVKVLPEELPSLKPIFSSPKPSLSPTPKKRKLSDLENDQDDSEGESLANH